MSTTLRRLMMQATRSVPEAFGLKLDDNGFTTVFEFVQGFNDTQPVSTTATEVLAYLDSDAYFDIVMTEDAVRFRAKKLHTTTQFDYPVCAPDSDLFCGVSSGDLNHLLDEGLYPLRSRYFPLYESEEEATGNWGKSDDLTLRVKAVEAHERGIPFYHYCDQWFGQDVPAWALEID